eukprot:jgi/Botrbrau1/16657/Bobra.0068s0073.1
MSFRTALRNGFSNSCVCPTSSPAMLSGASHVVANCNLRRPVLQSSQGSQDRSYCVKASASPSPSGEPSANRGPQAPHAYAPARELNRPADLPLISGTDDIWGNDSESDSDVASYFVIDVEDVVDSGLQYEAPIEFVIAPVKDEIEAVFDGNLQASTSQVDAGVRARAVAYEEFVAPVKREIKRLRKRLTSTKPDENGFDVMMPIVRLFEADGKYLRPTIVLLVARATAHCTGLRDLTNMHRILASITEKIHAASLIHDDIVDDAEVRRGVASAQKLVGNRTACFAGDYLFGQASFELGQLDNPLVIRYMSHVIRDFALGEKRQKWADWNINVKLEDYLGKSFKKTASIMANSCRSAAVMSGASQEIQDAVYTYAGYLGMAFQLVDDILDYTVPEEETGKPQGQDLKSGNLTAPALFALQTQTYGSELAPLITEAFFSEPRLRDRALELVLQSGGIEKSRQLARKYADAALDALKILPDSPERRALEVGVEYVLTRRK